MINSLIGCVVLCWFVLGWNWIEKKCLRKKDCIVKDGRENVHLLAWELACRPARSSSFLSSRATGGWVKFSQQELPRANHPPCSDPPEIIKVLWICWKLHMYYLTLRWFRKSYLFYFYSRVWINMVDGRCDFFRFWWGDWDYLALKTALSRRY